MEPKKEEPQPTRVSRRKRSSPLAESLAAIIASAVFLVIANNLLDWHLSFITADWEDILPLLTIITVISMGMHAVLLFFRAPQLRYFGKTVLDIMSIVLLIQIFAIYPFNFNVLGPDYLDTIVRIALLVGMGGTLIGMIGRTVTTLARVTFNQT